MDVESFQLRPAHPHNIIPKMENPNMNLSISNWIEYVGKRFSGFAVLFSRINVHQSVPEVTFAALFLLPYSVSTQRDRVLLCKRVIQMRLSCRHRCPPEPYSCDGGAAHFVFWYLVETFRLWPDYVRTEIGIKSNGGGDCREIKYVCVSARV